MREQRANASERDTTMGERIFTEPPAVNRCAAELHAGPTGVWTCQRELGHDGACWATSQTLSEMGGPVVSSGASWRCWLGRHTWAWKHDGRVMELRCARCPRWRPWGRKQRRWEVIP